MELEAWAYHLLGKIASLIVAGVGIVLFLKLRGWRLYQPNDERAYATLLGAIVLGVCAVVAFS